MCVLWGGPGEGELEKVLFAAVVVNGNSSRSLFIHIFVILCGKLQNTAQFPSIHEYNVSDVVVLRLIKKLCLGGVPGGPEMDSDSELPAAGGEVWSLVRGKIPRAVWCGQKRKQKEAVSVTMYCHPGYSYD